MMAISDLTVRQAKAADKTYSLPDTDGLGLVVAPTGGKSWHLLPGQLSRDRPA
ncbi:hypothetical protein GCM10009090_11670 [[Pseudomonas] boreopolis]|uniref:Integrase DNA-binding domain-containing protein n=1 Tax=Xanthomonas boreopolis TaxID=86183 RepID=A0A919F6F0_9XANT|nr:hypothetical protein GCM10009090_11670 [[Pseudomonas] boreopolis]